MAARLFPFNIQVIGPELAIAWHDGTETFLPVEQLRRLCPCAVCGGGARCPRICRPSRGAIHSGELRAPRSWQIVGGYAVQPTWGDGHGSGLYAFDYLRKIRAEKH